MVCTSNDLQRWKDFPKGLRVLLLERDSNSATEIRVKLEAMDYKVLTFYDENEALSAISSTPEGFHVAIVEVSTSSSEECFKFLENAKDLPTIMTSNNQCLSTMMKCIALGAVEFLNKPLSDDKLRNIWQHVVHKAFNARSESLKPVKESVESMLQLQADNENLLESKISIDTENVPRFSDNNDLEHNAGSDRYPAPSTPQLKQVSRLLDDGDCQEQITNCSTEKEGGEHDDGESKSVETSCENILNAESTPNPQNSDKTMMIKEEEEDDGSKGEMTEDAVSLNPHDRTFLSNPNDNTTTPSEKAGVVLSDSCETTKANRKKMKVDWTPDLHKKFVQAVEQLGVDHAIPSRILELMKVEGLTRHNVASHLQKYRMHKRQIVPRDVDRRCQNQRDQMEKSYCLQRPVMAYPPPPYHSNHTPLSTAPPPIYHPMWRQSGSQTAGVQIWRPPGYPPLWQPAETWHWNPFSGMHHVDAWGCSVFPPPQAPCFSYPQNMAAGLHNAKAVDYKFGMPPSSFDQYPEEEVVDKIVKEAISKPWLPLPLGLKPPSTDSVLAELSKKGLSTTIPLSRLATTKDSKPR